MAVDQLNFSVVSRKAPITPRPKPGPTARAEAPGGSGPVTDVAKFTVLPLSGAPMVSAVDDPTLGNLDPIAKLLSKLEASSKIGAAVAKTARVFTRVVGPGMYMFSAYLNIKNTINAWKDKSLGLGSKIALTAGTTGISLGAVCATISTLPLKLAKFLHIGKAGTIAANKLSGIFGGIGGIIFSTINMIETSKRKDAKPAERLLSRLGFGLGILGFIAGTTALAISMPALLPAVATVAAKLPWLLGLATKVANIVGIAGLATLGAQNFLGKNKWLNEKLEGKFLT